MSNNVIAINIPPTPGSPKGDAAQPPIQGAPTVSQSWTDHLIKAARPRNLPAKKLTDRTVTPLNLRATLEKAGVPQSLIDKINPPAVPALQAPNSSPSSRASNALEMSLTPSADLAEPEQPKASEMAAFAVDLLNKGYMRLLRFEAGDLPFSQEVCDELSKHKATVDECRQTLEKTAKELSDELTKSCASDCLPEATCSVDQKTALLAIILIAWTILGVAGGAVVGDDPKATKALLILTHIISGGALAGKLFSYHQSGKKEEADATAQRTLLDVQNKLNKALVSIRQILSAQQALLKSHAEQLIEDYVDATPLLNSTTMEEREGSLKLTYSETGENRKKMQLARLKMRVQAELIEHFVANQFDQASPLIRNAMESYIPESEFHPKKLLKNFRDVRPLVCPQADPSRGETAMYRVYRQSLDLQTAFIRLMSSANNSGQTLPFTTLHARAIHLFPLSCASLAPAQFVARASRGSRTSPSNSSDRAESRAERKGDRKDEARVTPQPERKRAASQSPQQPAERTIVVGLPGHRSRQRTHSTASGVSVSVPYKRPGGKR